MIVQNIADRKLSTVYANETNLKGKLRKKLRGPSKNLGDHGPPRASLRTATGYYVSLPFKACASHCSGRQTFERL